MAPASPGTETLTLPFGTAEGTDEPCAVLGQGPAIWLPCAILMNMGFVAAAAESQQRLVGGWKTSLSFMRL